MSSFEGKVAIVTGATSGIGKAVACALADAGASVVLVGRRLEEGERIVKQMKDNGKRGSFVQADVSRQDEVERAIRFTLDTHGRLDLAVNNAGIEHIGSIFDVTKDDFDRIMSVNLWGIVYCMKLEIKAMLQAGGGRGSIVNCSSFAGQRGVLMVPIYTASKHAVEGLTKSVALEYAKEGIRVNCVAPGSTWTEIAQRAPPDVAKYIESKVPMQRWAAVEEIVPAILFLLSSESAYVTGATIAVDGGMSV